MEERAVRSGWLIDGEIKGKILARLLRTIQRDDVWMTEEGEPITNDREVNAAAKTLVYADLGQQRLDMARQHHADRQYAEALAVEQDEAGSAEPVDPAIYDWYSPTCPCNLPAGNCKLHPRARESQHPPVGDWSTWAYIAGRGAGKTRAGASWVQSRVDAGFTQICLIAPTANDIRDVMIEGPSGILAASPPWNKAVFIPSKRRVVWRNGAKAICLSGEEPERARGLNIDTLWADELACWQYPETTWNLAALATRHGSDPRSLITTTPRRVEVLKKILAQATTVKTNDTTYSNEANLPKKFFDTIVGMFQGTRLGRQELMAEFLDMTEGAWFANFDPAKHVSIDAEYHPGYPVHLAIDAGTSRHTAAVFLQIRPPDGQHFWPRVTVFAEYHAADVVSRKNALAIKAYAAELPCQGRIDLVRVDPAATAKSSLGPAAYGEYESVFGSRLLARWPMHLVLDGLDTMELLLDGGNLTMHPRCPKLKDSFNNYCKKKRGSEWIDFPADGHPEEDMMDALRGGIRDGLPDGATTKPTTIRTMHASRIT